MAVCPWTGTDRSIHQSPYRFYPCTVSVCPWAGADLASLNHYTVFVPVLFRYVPGQRPIISSPSHHTFLSLYFAGYPLIAAGCSVPQFLYRLCPCIVGYPWIGADCSNLQTEAEFPTNIRTRHRLNMQPVTATCGWPQ